MAKCPQCVDGYIDIEEDGRPVRHPCYHCGTEGVISDEQVFQDRFTQAIYLLARNHVGSMRQVQAMDDDFNVAAAECGMSPHELYRNQIEQRAEWFHRLLYPLESQPGGNALLRALTDTLCPEVREEPEPVPARVVESSYPTEDEIPF